MHVSQAHPAIHPAVRRTAYAALTALLLTAAIAELLRHGGGWWLFAAFAIGPDLVLLFGMGANLERGQVHTRAVRLYNAAHGYWGPSLLALASPALGFGALIGAMAWALHVSLDRSVGYGMRTRDGFQRS